MPRADQRLVELGLVSSRARAQAEIAAGRVTQSGARVRKPSETVAPDAQLELKDPENPWVGRGGLKLAHALDLFALSVDGAAALDIGASTGGFTQVLLARGARRVYAVDVGRDQMHGTIRSDARVIVLEQTNARDLDRSLIPETVDFIVADVSFISLKLVLPPALALSAAAAHLIVLVKPQFEVGPGFVSKGIVHDASVRALAVAEIRRFLEQTGWRVIGETPSPIRGGDGNEEVLLAAERA